MNRRRRRLTSGEGAPPTVPSAFGNAAWAVTPGNTLLTIDILSLPSNGGSPITDVEYRLDGGAWTSSGGTNDFNITSLINDQEYEVEIRAVNAIGEGAASSIKTGTPFLPDTVPDAFEAGDWSIASGDTEADVTINSLPADGGDAITDIEYRLDGGSWVSSGGVVSFTITGLTNGVEYDVQLRAVNGVGAGAASDTKQVTPAAPPVGEFILLEGGTDRLLLEAGGPVEIDVSIPAQAAATTLDGSEWTVVVQGGTTKKMSTALLMGYLNG